MTAPLTLEEIAARNSAAVGEVGALFCELGAVLECMDDAIDGLWEGDAGDRRTLESLKGLAMAAIRLNREVGRQVGAV